MIYIGLMQSGPLKIHEDTLVIEWPPNFRLLVVPRAISKVNRFTGQTERSYSVAEHSTRLSDLFEDPVLKRAALLHDAAEGLGVNDLNFAVKEKLCPDIRLMEDVILSDLWVRYGGVEDLPWQEVHHKVKDLDRHLGNWEYLEFDLGDQEGSLYNRIRQNTPAPLIEKNTGLAGAYQTQYLSERRWVEAWQAAGGVNVETRWDQT